jgi:hypothetical protein
VWLSCSPGANALPGAKFAGFSHCGNNLKKLQASDFAWRVRIESTCRGGMQVRGEAAALDSGHRVVDWLQLIVNKANPGRSFPLTAKIKSVKRQSFFDTF